MREITLATHRELVELEREILTSLSEPPHLRKPVRLLWQIGRSPAGITATRKDHLLDTTIDVCAPNAPALAQIIQRFDLGGSAQRGELTQHDADGWRSLTAERDALRQQLVALERGRRGIA